MMQLKLLDDITQHYDHVYISPHFDDAVVSCGGRIVDQITAGYSVLVVTVFTGVAATKNRAPKRTRRFIFDYRRRRKEDAAAMAALGVDFLWLGYPEILFRNRCSMFRYWPCYRHTPANGALCASLVSGLKNVCRKTRCKYLVLPLAVGQHMDHQLVFQAGMDLLGSAPPPCQVLFYEDCPYMLFPYMLCYRMKITGGYHRGLPDTNEFLKASYPSARKDAIDLLAGRPESKLRSMLLRAVSALFILIFGFYTQHLMKARKSLPGKRVFFSQEHCDVSRHFERKLNAIMAYPSQLDRPVLQRQQIRKILGAYSEFIGAPKNSFYERYWRVKLESAHELDP